MDADLQRLHEILTNHCRIQERQVALEKAKREAIVKNDTAALEQILAEQKELARLTQRDEEARARTSAKLCEQLGLAPASRLEEIVAALSEEEAGRIRPLRERLGGLLAELRERVDRNAMLLGASLEHLHRFFVAVAGAGADKPVYGRGGKTLSAGASLLDQTI